MTIHELWAGAGPFVVLCTVVGAGVIGWYGAASLHWVLRWVKRVLFG